MSPAKGRPCSSCTGSAWGAATGISRSPAIAPWTIWPAGSAGVCDGQSRLRWKHVRSRGPPCGPSPPLQDVAAVIDFIRSGSAAAGVCLVGHSWGGIVASVAAATHPGLVDSLVLIGMPYRRLHRQFEERLAVMLRRVHEPRRVDAESDPRGVGGSALRPRSRGAGRVQGDGRDRLPPHPRRHTGRLPGIAPRGTHWRASPVRCSSCAATFETVVDQPIRYTSWTTFVVQQRTACSSATWATSRGSRESAHGTIDRIVADWAFEWAE